MLHTQLLASIGALKDESSHNADVLDEAAEPAEGDNVGTLYKGKLRTLHKGSALPAIRQLNLAATAVVDEVQLRKARLRRARRPEISIRLMTATKRDLDGTGSMAGCDACGRACVDRRLPGSRVGPAAPRRHWHTRVARSDA